MQYDPAEFVDPSNDNPLMLKPAENRLVIATCRPAIGYLVQRLLITLGCLIVAAATCLAQPEIAATAASGWFEVIQEYQSEHTPTIRFRDRSVSAVRLPAFPWPGIFTISPDELWVLRTQKTGSGDSIAMLYRIEENGRVSEVVGFDETLWSASDKVARLKRKALYHTGIEDSSWSDDGRRLEIVLGGSEVAESGAGIRSRVIYDLEKGVTSGKEMPSQHAD